MRRRCGLCLGGGVSKSPTWVGSVIDRWMGGLLWFVVLANILQILATAKNR